jgi:hypothetical protein
VTQNQLLSEKYYKGIIKTWFKSTELKQVNELRALYNMPFRKKAISVKHYDRQLFEKIESTDFSPLDTYISGEHNNSKLLVLGLSIIDSKSEEYILDGI